jgi:hypothetical protein
MSDRDKEVNDIPVPEFAGGDIAKPDMGDQVCGVIVTSSTTVLVRNLI